VRIIDAKLPGMRLQQILFAQGFGSRRECDGLICHGLVQLGDRVLLDGQEELEPEGLVLRVQGQDWTCHERAVVLLHKPAGYECSRQPRHHPSVLTLLPPPLRRRGVQPVGRLDEDTTGLLLLTDDGALIHRLTHPRRHVPKVYEVSTAHPVDAGQLQRLLAGVVLNDDPAPARAAACEAIGSHHLRLTITEGRYHQVKRMVAAAGNRVLGLHRSAFGALILPADLAPGQWRWLTDDALAQLSAAGAVPAAPG
jgi:16S rRNA pseudouridine516 synthase